MQKINSITIANSPFTGVLNNYPGMPNQLYFRGKLPTTRPAVVAIVGSRRPTVYGLSVTQQFAYSLAQKGVVIISGLAFGIDRAAHLACLDAGGITLAVAPGGLHTTYPRAHHDLAQQITNNGGAILSEYQAGVEPRAYHFLARNRLVSGLADAILVTEATDRSGTFSTVAHALNQNKEVFAIPGPITSLLSAGANRILQEGARVALTPDDILRVIAPALLKTDLKQSRLILGDTPLEQAIIDGIRQGIYGGDQLQAFVTAQSKQAIDTADFLRTITLMELKGTIIALGGQQWTLR